MGRQDLSRKIEVFSNPHEIERNIPNSLKNGWVRTLKEVEFELSYIIFKLNQEYYNTLSDSQRNEFRLEVRRTCEFLIKNFVRRKGRGGWCFTTKPRD